MRDALRLYESMLPYILNLSSTFANTSEHQSWTERFLSRYCTLASRHVTAHAGQPHELLSNTATIPSASLLAPFRAYANHWDSKTTARIGAAAQSSKVWRAYYDVLSVILQAGMVQPIFQSKLQQSKELKSVEKTYETILLKEVSFPRADQASTLIENWVDQVMANWRMMCSSTWRDEDLQGDSKAALGHGVLDVGSLSTRRA